MQTAALHELIGRAYQQEAKSGQLRQLLAGQLDTLHPAIQLPANDPLGVLTGFVCAYIEQVPDVLDAAAKVACEAGIEAQVKPILVLAEGFFLNPPLLMDGHEGLESLLDEAYLAHRLVEEVNDFYISHLGQALIPLDTTIANLIAHRLIGEPFANELDKAVHEATQSLLNQPVFAREAIQACRTPLTCPQTCAAWQRWPCLSRQLGIELKLDQPRRSGLPIANAG